MPGSMRANRRACHDCVVTILSLARAAAHLVSVCPESLLVADDGFLQFLDTVGAPDQAVFRPASTLLTKLML